MMGSLQNNLQNLLDLQRQMITQNKYSKISDNPAEIARALSLESSMISNTEYIANQEDAITMLKYAETAMDSAINIVQTIREKVIYAGDGALDSTAVAAIADEIDALKEQLLDTLNTKVAGKYLFGGTDTTKAPFAMDANGRIRYVGSDERIRYEIEQGVLGDVSFTGTDVMPNDYKSYFVCSHYVPLDWQWTGREEKVQITVGNRTLPVFIPEQWIDEVATGTTKPTDYNQFRDPDELSGISLDDIATLVNRALTEQGVDMLVKATVEKNYDTGLQRLVFKSTTGEPISITGWPDTDYMPMAQSLAGLSMRDSSGAINLPDWNSTMLAGSKDVNFAALPGSSLTISVGGVTQTPISLTAADAANMSALLTKLNGSLPAGVTAQAQGNRLVLVSANGESLQVDDSSTAAAALFGTVKNSQVPKYEGLMGTVNTLGWKGDGLGKNISVIVGGGPAENFNLDDYKNISELVSAINVRMTVDAGDQPFASIVAGRLMLQSSKGDIAVGGTGTAQLFGQDYVTGINSSSSSLTLKPGEGQAIKIYINDGDSMAQIADRINSIEGIYARTSADGDQLVVVAQRTGNAAADPLAVDAAKEKLNYPSFIIWGEGAAMSLFDFSYSVDPDTGIETGVLGSKEQTRPVDHSHIDLFDYLGMETALKSVEFKEGQTLQVGTETPPGSGIYTGDPLHWRVMSGKRVTDIMLNPGTYTMEQLAERLKNAGAGWLEVTVDVFCEPNIQGADDTERGLGTSYNEEMSTSRLVIRSTEGLPVVFMDMNSQRYAEQMGLSTAVRTDDSTGVTDIQFPTAPCLDDNLAAMMRIQMTCGKSYDIRLTKKDVVDKATGLVDRVKVMEQIAKQVNAQAGEEVLRVVIPVDANGQKLPNSASLVAMTGEPFSVVDLPVADPLWKEYTAGLAAQMGIHSGVTAIPDLDDDEPIGTTGTIRFESLGRTVEIDVTANDTAKDIMDRLRAQAGDWLYVNYFDATMGNKGGQEGDTPIISIAARDGSAVNIIDVKGTVAQDRLLLSTGIQGNKTFYSGGSLDTSIWSIPVGNPPTGDPLTFSITVDGYTHTIDLSAMRDVNGNGLMDAEDLVATINARMQDYDVRAQLNGDGMLVLWSPRGYSIKVGGTDKASDVSTFFTVGSSTGGSSSTPASSSVTSYRGGYDLENPNRTSPGIYTQNVTVRSGSNQMKQNFFGVLDDISSAVRSQNRDGLSDKMLPQIDKFMDNLLRMLSTDGALQIRYTGNIERMKLNNITMTEAYDSLAKIDLSEISTQMMMAQAIYEASLGVMAKIVQPTLLDFLR